VIACDVGHCLDLYANFGHPQRYVPFPDSRTYRVTLDRLGEPAVQERLRLAFTDPHALDPARRQAAVTRELAATLAALAARLEGEHAPDAVFGFLSRCLFTMFAEDARLLPERSFTGLLAEYRDHLDVLPRALDALWATMAEGGFAPSLKVEVRRFNGGLFAETAALPLDAEALDLLLDAAAADWREVEPAIFGTLLERALDPRERHKLGAHYTPRAYVERLVGPAVVDPLREEWEAVQVEVAQIEAASEERAAGRETDAEAARRQRETKRAALDALGTFLARLTSVRVLDPACGSGNFLYVTLEHLKRIEGEVHDAMRRYGAGALDLEGVAVTPAQLLGIEVNPRAAAIADLVLWIGYLQWHLRTHGDYAGLSDPVLKAYGNVQCRDAVLDHAERTPRLGDDGAPVTIWDGRTTTPHPATGEPVPDVEARVPVYDYADPRPADWPEATFIVGNPPFVGNKRMRDALGDGYTEALRAAYPDVPGSADLVMYWWHKAALAVRTGEAERFGFITTNSITMAFNQKVLEHHLGAEPPLALAFAVPDHPWVDSAEGAAVRVAMTVGVPGPAEGECVKVISEARTEVAEARDVETISVTGQIFADLGVGVDVTSVETMRANGEISNRGMIPHGSGFLVSDQEAQSFGQAATAILRPYRNGSDITRKLRHLSAIDTFGLSADEVRDLYPAVYQHLLDEVKPARDQNRRKSRRENWWLFAENQPRLRDSIADLDRYIVTPQVAKHHLFVFLDGSILPDDKLIVIASDDAHHLGVLSSRIHEVWALGAGGRLGVGNDPVYSKTKTFEPFPFPAPEAEHEQKIRDLGERLDQHRKRVQDADPGLTLTALYNVLAAVRAGTALSDKEKTVYEAGQVGLLRETHDALDAAVAAAYGWPAGLPEAEVLRRLVALNAARQAEEAAGHVRYLRPSFQAPGEVTQTTLDVAVPEAEPAAAAPAPWPAATKDRARAVRRVLREADRPLSVEAVRGRFKGARRATVADLLETLAELGQARATEAGYAA
ncbi:MAG: DNA methyltransferase, partial [Bacteroidota bacterium]